MEGVRKRAGGTPAKATNGTKSPVELAKIRKTKKHQERLEDSWLLTALALALLAVFALGSVYVYRDELFPEGFKPYNAPEAAKATADVALCSLPLPHDFACPEAGACPLPDNEACAARYAKMDTVAELRMVERKPQLTIVSAEPAKGNEAKHTVLIGPQQPHNGTKIDAYTTQPPTESCANVAVNVTVASADPWLIVLDGFLTDDEVDHGMKNGMPGLQPSGQFHGDEESKKAYDASYRTSSTAYIGKVKDEIVTCIERRASDFSGYPLPNIEALQFLRYQIGQEYKHHWLVSTRLFCQFRSLTFLLNPGIIFQRDMLHGMPRSMPVVSVRLPFSST
jgi:hypothetical protein